MKHDTTCHSFPSNRWFPSVRRFYAVTAATPSADKFYDGWKILRKKQLPQFLRGRASNARHCDMSTSRELCTGTLTRLHTRQHAVAPSNTEVCPGHQSVHRKQSEKRLARSWRKKLTTTPACTGLASFEAKPGCPFGPLAHDLGLPLRAPSRYRAPSSPRPSPTDRQRSCAPTPGTWSPGFVLETPSPRSTVFERETKEGSEGSDGFDARFANGREAFLEYLEPRLANAQRRQPNLRLDMSKPDGRSQGRKLATGVGIAGTNSRQECKRADWSSTWLSRARALCKSSQWAGPVVMLKAPGKHSSTLPATRMAMLSSGKRMS